ncbi:MAG: hypothetical protein K9I36_07085 [Bacteroidia bacterium]|nr:hypothetical protein [Bacteroidia bacterium]MCF8426478.1 hypothetical protein [Bacteroidia bacterium]
MNKRIFLLWILPIMSLVALFYIQPFIVPYFAMSTTWKFIYILIVFGFPILVLIPIALFAFITTLLEKKSGTFKERWFKHIGNGYIAIGFVILLMSAIVVFTKLVFNHNPFPKMKYSEIVIGTGNCEDIKLGNFKGRYRYITRLENEQIEYSFNYKDTFYYSLQWLSPCEYRLIAKEDYGMNDTIDVKVTNNTENYYEGFVRFDQYAAYTRVEKKWK